jgi:hypothetical protein
MLSPNHLQAHIGIPDYPGNDEFSGNAPVGTDVSGAARNAGLMHHNG